LTEELFGVTVIKRFIWLRSLLMWAKVKNRFGRKMC